jgi:predicted RNase H-like HicB family nuclease
MAFNTSTVSKITGLSIRQLDYWDTRHFIKPSTKEAAGYGSARLYSFRDVVQLKVAKALKEEGISLQKLRKSISYLKKHFPNVEKSLSELRFVTDGKSIFVLTEDKTAILNATLKGQLVMTLAIGRLISDLKGEVERINRDREYKVRAGKKNYKVILHPDTEDGGFWVECPSLPGCVSQGDTVEEALEMIKDAIEGHLEIMAEDKPQKVKRAA